MEDKKVDESPKSDSNQTKPLDESPSINRNLISQDDDYDDESPSFNRNQNSTYDPFDESPNVDRKRKREDDNFEENDESEEDDDKERRIKQRKINEPWFIPVNNQIVRTVICPYTIFLNIDYIVRSKFNPRPESQYILNEMKQPEYLDQTFIAKSSEGKVFVTFEDLWNDQQIKDFSNLTWKEQKDFLFEKTKELKVGTITSGHSTRAKQILKEDNYKLFEELEKECDFGVVEVRYIISNKPKLIKSIGLTENKVQYRFTVNLAGLTEIVKNEFSAKINTFGENFENITNEEKQVIGKRVLESFPREKRESKKVKDIITICCLGEISKIIFKFIEDWNDSAYVFNNSTTSSASRVKAYEFIDVKPFFLLFRKKLFGDFIKQKEHIKWVDKILEKCHSKHTTMVTNINKQIGSSSIKQLKEEKFKILDYFKEKSEKKRLELVKNDYLVQVLTKNFQKKTEELLGIFLKGSFYQKKKDILYSIKEKNLGENESFIKLMKSIETDSINMNYYYPRGKKTKDKKYVSKYGLLSINGSLSKEKNLVYPLGFKVPFTNFFVSMKRSEEVLNLRSSQESLISLKIRTIDFHFYECKLDLLEAFVNDDTHLIFGDFEKLDFNILKETSRNIPIIVFCNNWKSSENFIEIQKYFSKVYELIGYSNSSSFLEDNFVVKKSTSAFLILKDSNPQKEKIELLPEECELEKEMLDLGEKCLVNFLEKTITVINPENILIIGNSPQGIVSLLNENLTSIKKLEMISPRVEDISTIRGFFMKKGLCEKMNEENVAKLKERKEYKLIEKMITKAENEENELKKNRMYKNIKETLSSKLFWREFEGRRTWRILSERIMRTIWAAKEDH